MDEAGVVERENLNKYILFLILKVSVVRFEAPILFHNSSYFKACIRESAAKIKG